MTERPTDVSDAAWVEKDCPFCGSNIAAPKPFVEKQVNKNNIFDCPECDEPVSFSGKWSKTDTPDTEREKYEKSGEGRGH